MILIQSAFLKTDNINILLGSTVTFNCSARSTQRQIVTNIIWQDRNRIIGTVITATGVVKIENEYTDTANILIINRSDELIINLRYKILSIQTNCYSCNFIIGNNSLNQQVYCITTYMPPVVLLSYRYLNSYLDVTCSATAYPRPIITIFFSKEWYSRKNPIHKKNINGTETTTLSFIFKKSSKTYMGRSITCIAKGGEIIEEITKPIYMGGPYKFRQNSSKLLGDFYNNTGTYWIIFSFSLFIIIFFTVLSMLCRQSFQRN